MRLCKTEDRIAAVSLPNSRSTAVNRSLKIGTLTPSSCLNNRGSKLVQTTQILIVVYKHWKKEPDKLGSSSLWTIVDTTAVIYENKAAVLTLRYCRTWNRVPNAVKHKPLGKNARVYFLMLDASGLQQLQDIGPG